MMTTMMIIRRSCDVLLFHDSPCVVCVDLEHHISQLAHICIPAICVLTLDHATEGETLSPIFSSCRDLCRVSADSAVYLWL